MEPVKINVPKKELSSRAVWGLSAGAFAATLIVDQIPSLDALMFPFNLFVTFVHELGHGLSAILTGGRVLKFEIFQDGSGLATTAGGARLIVISAGYVGAALFGALLFYLIHRLRRPRLICLALAAMIMLASLMFARNLALIFGFASAGILAWIGIKAWDWVRYFFLNLLAMVTALNALVDIFFLFSSFNATVYGIPNDAVAAYQLTGIPAFVWALLWIAFAALSLLASFYFAVRDRRRDSATEVN